MIIHNQGKAFIYQDRKLDYTPLLYLIIIITFVPVKRYYLSHADWEKQEFKLYCIMYMYLVNGIVFDREKINIK